MQPWIERSTFVSFAKCDQTILKAVLQELFPNRWTGSGGSYTIRPGEGGEIQIAGENIINTTGIGGYIGQIKTKVAHACQLKTRNLRGWKPRNGKVTINNDVFSTELVHAPDPDEPENLDSVMLSLGNDGCITLTNPVRAILANGTSDTDQFAYDLADLMGGDTAVTYAPEPAPAIEETSSDVSSKSVALVGGKKK